MATLIVTKGPHAGDHFPLKAGLNVIGRSPELEIRLQDLTVSRHHLQIVADPSRRDFVVEDLQSTHGVFVNGVRLSAPVVLGEGDCVTAGSVELLFTRRDVADRGQALALLEAQQSELGTINYSASAIRSMTGSVVGSGHLPRQRLSLWSRASRTTLAIVFTDLVASTRMTSELGNEAMDRKLRAHFARVRSLVASLDGCEIKSSGDGFLLAFHAAVQAVDFALGLSRDPGDASLKPRVAIHVGPVMIEDEDIQGAAVIYAARLLENAVDGGIRVSAEVKNHLDQERAERHARLRWFRRSDEELKGFPGTHELWIPSESDGNP